MAVCSNCKSQLSCGCQRKIASDKTPVCNNCIGQYEAKLKTQKIKEDLKKIVK